MVKQTLLRLTRVIGRHWNGQRRRRAIQTEIQQVERLESRQLMTNQISGTFRPGHTVGLTSTSTASQSDSVLAGGSELHIVLNASANNQANLTALVMGPAPIPHSADLRLVFTEATTGAIDTNPFSTATNTASFAVDIPNLPANVESTFRVTVMRSTTVTLPVNRVLADPATQLIVSITNDTTPPSVSGFGAVTTPRKTPVESVTVTFSEAINAATFSSADISLTRDGSSVSLVDVSVASAGGNSFTISGLTDESSSSGSYVLTVNPDNISDTAGNDGSVGGSNSVSWTTDTSPPTNPTLATADDSGRDNTDAITNQRIGLTFTGTTSNASTVEVRLTLGAAVTTSNAMLSGSSYTAEFPGPLDEGTYTVTAVASDGVGTVTSSGGTLVIDATAPAQLTMFDLTTATDTKGAQISVDDNLTSTPTPTFTFSGAETDAAVTLMRDGTSDPASIPALGASVNSVTASTTSAGVHTFAVFQTDVAGNPTVVPGSPPSNLSAPLSVAIDTMKPLVTNLGLTLPLASNLKVPITTSTTPSIRFKLTDQLFSGFTNTTRLELVEKVSGTTGELQTATNNSVGTLTLVSAAAFPASGPFEIQIDSEHMRVTAVAGNTLTVTRGINGTNSTHAVGAVVTLLITLATRTTIVPSNSAQADTIPGNFFQNETITPSSAISTGQHTMTVRATDAAGNLNSSDFTFFVSQPGAATTDAPGTPVFSETYFLGSTVTTAALAGATTLIVDRAIPPGFRITVGDNTAYVRSVAPVLGGFQLTLATFSKVSSPTTVSATLIDAVAIDNRVTWLRPWTMTFDRTTQTVWFTNEDGSRLGQLDPATSIVKLYDVGLTGADGFPATDAIDSHGVFFDFDTHITPRVWFVYRNTETVQNAGGTTVVGNQLGRVSYLDLATGELVTVKLTDFIGADLIEQLHAAFVDARGHLWMSAEDSKTLIEFDFDQALNGTLNPNLNSRTGQAIVHKVPDTFANIEPHGLGTVVDDRTGEQYVYFTDAKNPGSGRVYLLKPGAEISGNVDRWFEWEMDLALTAEGRTTGHALFLAIDDHETPGAPEDDTILLVDPGRGIADPAGAIREIDPQSLIRAIQSGDPVPASSTVRSVIVPKIPGTQASATNSSPQLPFADREGNVFFVDALGSVGRFNFDDPGLTISSSISADINTDTTTATLFQVTMSPVSAQVTPLTLNAMPIGNAGRNDRSQKNGVDQYEVAQTSQRNRSEGAFRGFLNAANVVYGSLAQSDFVSSTVFAETARRQMSVVADPTALPDGAIVEGRMAFQVGRNGSLIMTSRGHGQLRDQQRNLSRDRILAGDTAAQILIDGDTSSVTEANGNVHVFGKNQAGGLVEYRFIKASNPANSWSTHVLGSAPIGTVLAGEPTAFMDGLGRVSALVNTSDGHVLLYRNDGSLPTDLTAIPVVPAPRIFASVDVVEDLDLHILYVYGVDQAGAVVEYRFSTEDAVPAAVTAVTLTVTPATGQADRDVRIFQSLNAVLAGGKRHIFGTDGHSRLVHLEVTGLGTAAGENVTELTKRDATGYFNSADPLVNSFQRGFEARVYPDLSVLVDPDDGNVYVYGTNGLDLVEFTRSGTNWTAADLTNDIMKGVGDRIPANKVFGAPGTYATSGGDRHVFQINADGEVIEYSFRKASGHFNTQNINLARGNSYTSLQDINVNVAPTLRIPAIPLDAIVGGPAVLVARDASVSDPDSLDFASGQLVVRTINSATSDVLSIRSQTLADGDVIASAAGVVSFNGVTFGSFTGGTDNKPLVVSFDSATSQNALEALLQSLEFSAPNTSSIGVRFVDFELTDDTGAQSNRVAQQVTVDDTDDMTNPLINPLL